MVRPSSIIPPGATTTTTTTTRRLARLFHASLALSTLLLSLSLAPTATAAAASPPAPERPDRPDLEISTDGTCGAGVTCLGSTWGQCCSGHGYCGNDEAYCGAECNAAFGVCGGGGAPLTCPLVDAPPLTATLTVSVCATRVTVTATRWETATTGVCEGEVPAPPVGGRSTRTVTVTTVGGGTAAGSGSGTGKTATVTVTVNSIVAGRTSTLTRWETTTVAQRSSTTTVLATSVSTRITFKSSTTIVTLTSCGVGSGSGSTRTTNVTPSSSGVTTVRATDSSEPAKPSPTLYGVISNCRKWYKVEEGDNCRKIANKVGITREQLYSWNPSLAPRNTDTNISICEGKQQVRMTHGICRVSCDDLWLGINLCVGA